MGPAGVVRQVVCALGRGRLAPQALRHQEPRPGHQRRRAQQEQGGVGGLGDDGPWSDGARRGGVGRRGVEGRRSSAGWRRPGGTGRWKCRWRPGWGRSPSPSRRSASTAWMSATTRLRCPVMVLIPSLDIGVGAVGGGIAFDRLGVRNQGSGPKAGVGGLGGTVVGGIDLLEHVAAQLGGGGGGQSAVHHAGAEHFGHDPALVAVVVLEAGQGQQGQGAGPRGRSSRCCPGRAWPRPGPENPAQVVVVSGAKSPMDVGEAGVGAGHVGRAPQSLPLKLPANSTKSSPRGEDGERR